MAVRREAVQNVGKVKSAKLAPVAMTMVKAGESGLLNQSVSVELDPVAGRMLTKVYAKVTSIYVPLQAMVGMLKGDEASTDAITEVIRRRLLNGESVIGVGPETEISKVAGINPRRISASGFGVNKATFLAYNCAVNFLRRERYLYAATLGLSDQVIQPAIIDQTVLDRFNGALDPDEHANGTVSLDLNQTTAPVTGRVSIRGIGFQDGFAPPTTTGDLIQDNGVRSAGVPLGNVSSSQSNPAIRKNADGTPSIYGDATSQHSSLVADLSAIQAGGFSLTDLYQAQKADMLIRQMREVADRNPQQGEDAVLRWCYGLEADKARFPFKIYEERIALGERRQPATDGAGILDEVLVSQMADTITFSVPVPRTELGGVVVTLLQVTPEEVIQRQPHPFFSADWTEFNHAADEMKVDPVPVTFGDLFSDVPFANVADQKFYTGYNELRRNYITFGFNRDVDPTTVSAKTVFWTYAIPAGVSPANINYPVDFSQYPFLDQAAKVVTFSATSVVSLKSDIFFGPTPVEKVAVVDTKNLLG